MVLTVRRVIWDTVSFLTLACMAMIGFGMAFLVMFGHVTSSDTLHLGLETEGIADINDNNQNYTVHYSNSPRSFDTTASALVFIFNLILGQFNHEVSSSQTSLFNVATVCVCTSS